MSGIFFIYTHCLSCANFLEVAEFGLNLFRVHNHILSNTAYPSFWYIKYKAVITKILKIIPISLTETTD